MPVILLSEPEQLRKQLTVAMAGLEAQERVLREQQAKKGETK